MAKFFLSHLLHPSTRFLIVIPLRLFFNERETNFYMKKQAAPNIDAQVLELLKRVLPKATKDLEMVNRILAAVQEELQLKKRGAAFEKFCERVELPNLEKKSI